MAEPIQFPVDIVQHDDQIEQPMQQHDVQQPPPPQQQHEPPVAAPDDLEVCGMVCSVYSCDYVDSLFRLSSNNIISRPIFTSALYA
jgi:hypothetical protein